jgi:hypothetical protein
MSDEVKLSDVKLTSKSSMKSPQMRRTLLGAMADIAMLLLSL